MENNIQEIELPPAFEGESDEDYGFRLAQTIGAFKMFSNARDYVVEQLKQFTQSVEGRELTSEEKKIGNQLRNNVIEHQAFVDVAFRFEQIETSAGLAVN